MKKVFAIIAITCFMVACGDNKEANKADEVTEEVKEAVENKVEEVKDTAVKMVENAMDTVAKKVEEVKK